MKNTVPGDILTAGSLAAAGNLAAAVSALLPALRACSIGDYGIALGGAHAKGVDDAESDIDLYVFARKIQPGAERSRILAAVRGVEELSAWGEDEPFEQAGSDFCYQGKKVEVWFRSLDYITSIVEACQQGVTQRDYVAWTVMGFYNYCTLSDLSKMQPLDDPACMLASWKAAVAIFPPVLRGRIIRQHYIAARFWPDNFHYKTAIKRCDIIYTAGIVQQTVYNMIQVLFALNEVYFPGEKKMAAALEQLAVKPDGFTRRIQALLFPGMTATTDALNEQRQELAALVEETAALVTQAGLAL
jgi:hypothetical protein